jgi:diguanylate cyclase (GGDEF)-like protein
LLLTPIPTVLQDMRVKSQATISLYDSDGQLLGSTLSGLPTSVDAATRSFLQLSAPGRASERAINVHGDPYEWQVTTFYLRQRPEGYLAVALSRQAVVDAGVRSAAQMTILFASVVLLLLVIGYLLALRLTRPIDEMVALTQAVARGDLTRRVTVRRSDELGTLGRAFNAMTADLQERTRALNDQMRRLAALYQAGQGLEHGADAAEVARAILALPLRALGIERGVLLSRASEDQPLEVRSAIGLSGESVSQLLESAGSEPGRGLSDTPRAEVELVSEADADPRPAVAAFSKVTEAAQVMVVPLVQADRSTGYLLVDAPAGALPAEDVRLLQTVATEMALMLENAQLRRTAELQAHRLDQAIVALEKISQALTAVTVGADNLLRAVAHAAADILDVPYASIHLQKPSWRERFTDVLVGAASQRELAAIRASGEEVARRVDRPEQVVEVELAAEGRNGGAGARRLGLQRAVACAMTQNGEIAGVLVIHMRAARRLVPSELRVLQTLANQAVIALGAAEAYEATRQLATTDSMTGVANYREFQTRLDRELQRSRRSREPLSVIMCDLDYFKRINDTVGHPGGDAVLRYLAQDVLLPTVRPKDLVARYGGDEFVLLLRGVDARAATAVAERIRSTFSGRPLLYEGQVITDLSLSLGVASFPRDGETREALVQAADQALYVAKRSGRNRVTRRDSSDHAEIAS